MKFLFNKIAKILGEVFDLKKILKSAYIEKSIGGAMLVVSEKVAKRLISEPMILQPPSAEELEKLAERLTQFGEEYEEGNFAEYRLENPQFFSG